MFRELLCFLGFHSWHYVFDEQHYYDPQYRYCPHCKRCEKNRYMYIQEWYRIEDIKDNSTIETLEKIYNNS